jgi:hypothetical protein
MEGMNQMLQNQFLWAVVLAGGVIGLVVITKAPELLVALLLVGQDFIQFAVRLVGFQVTRREFAGAVIFLPIVLLFLIMRMLQVRGKEPIIGRPNYSFILVSVAIGLWLLIGLMWTPADWYGGRKTAEYFIFGMAPMLLAFVFIRDRASVNRFLWWIVAICAAMVILVSAYSLATRGTLLTNMVFLETDAPETWGGIDVAGHGELSTAVLGMVAALLALGAGREGFLWKILPILVLPVATFYIIHAGTRSNLVAFCIIATVGYFLAYKAHRGIFVAALFVVLIFGATFLMFSGDETRERMFSSWVAEGTVHGHGGAERVAVLEQFPRWAIQAPILGHGTGAFPILEGGREYYYAFPHNMFVEMQLENGFIGLALLLVLWYLVVRRVWRHLQTAEPNTELYGLAIYGVCLLVVELCTALAHFGLAHASCTFLLSSAIILRTTFLAEEGRTDTEEEEEEGVEFVYQRLHAQLR